jgi:hypothetical protein
MAKLTVNEVKHIDAMQEALEELKKPRFRNLGDYGKHIKSLSSPSRDEKAIIVYSVLDMIESKKQEWGEMNIDKLLAILTPIATETGIEVTEMRRILMYLLADVVYFQKISRAFYEVFEDMRH